MLEIVRCCVASASSPLPLGFRLDRESPSPEEIGTHSTSDDRNNGHSVRWGWAAQTHVTPQSAQAVVRGAPDGCALWETASDKWLRQAAQPRLGGSVLPWPATASAQPHSREASDRRSRRSVAGQCWLIPISTQAGANPHRASAPRAQAWIDGGASRIGWNAQQNDGRSWLSEAPG